VDRPPRRRSFLADAVWGQFCLFQCVRLQDDVFDRHSADAALVYAGDQFLIESERTLARHFPITSPFWEIWRTAFETTTRSIVTVDAMQKRVGGDPARLGRQYAKVGAIFQVGAAAVCLAHRKPRAIGPVRRFFDAIAIGDQILDDLDDVEDDLRRGRFNYVAQRLQGGHARLARALVAGDGADVILGDARRHFTRAAAVARRLRIPGMTALAAAALRSVDERQRAFHRAQVARTFRPLR
jgi:hypothetical protein